MKKLLLVLFCLGLVGCATLEGFRMKNRQNLLQLSIGMTKQEVMNIMGNEAVYDFSGSSANNPYRSEIMQGKDKTFEVLYYYTDIKASDGAITDDELTPVVFDNGKAIGWGWSFLQDNAQKYEIRVR